MVALAPEYKNHLLSKMALPDLRLLRPSFELVTIKMQQMLQAPGAAIDYAYFLEDGIASVLAPTSRDRRIEIGMVGFEGVIGIELVLGAGRSTNEVIVQASGKAMRIPAAVLVDACRVSQDLRRLLLLFVHTIMVEQSQTALINGRGTLAKRLARWILMTQDRLQGEEIPTTHAFLSLMLGVRRPGVTLTIHILESKHLIKATRGLLRVLDRAGLIAEANGFYGVAEAEYERLLGAPFAQRHRESSPLAAGN